MNTAQRNLLYAWLRDSGAASLVFLDTQPTGKVVRDLGDLRALGVTLRDIEKFCAERGITDWHPRLYPKLFAGLDRFVQVVSAAPHIADKLAPETKR